MPFFVFDELLETELPRSTEATSPKDLWRAGVELQNRNSLQHTIGRVQKVEKERYEKVLWQSHSKDIVAYVREVGAVTVNYVCELRFVPIARPLDHVVDYLAACDRPTVVELLQLLSERAGILPSLVRKIGPPSMLLLAARTSDEAPQKLLSGSEFWKRTSEENQRPDRDICVDGSAWDDSPEAAREWVAWFDALEPVFAGDELALFETNLVAMREEQKGLLSDWHDEIQKLFP